MQLDTIYGAPGFLLLARAEDGERLGCVGLRALSDGPGEAPTGEIRRLFVRPQGRGAGIGRDLAETVRAAAVDAGFDQLVLNTLPEMSEAIRLYESMGFRHCDPYVDEPLAGVLYHRLDLRDHQ